MPSGQVFELALLLTLKDLASGRLDGVEAKLRETGKEGKALLKTFQNLRGDLQKGLTIGGVGLGILAGLRNGLNAAGDYEMSLLDIKSAYQEVTTAGGLSAQQQAANLNRLDQLAVRLGNNLQGNTSDYIGILTSLKRAGVDVETVLGGAGEAASYLANVSGALLQGRANEQAKELGQFGKLFKLRPEEFKKSVDLFSALKDRFDIESSQIIESAKYFQNTANSLKLTGFGGAEETSKFFALAKRFGALEGSQAGTSATSFFQQFIAKADQRAKIKKATGLDIKLFDAKGEFLGMENAFREMEKFRKFSSEKRLSLLNEIFGEQGGKMAGVMVEAGAEGWRSITTESSKAVSVNEKINQQMATYNAKMEALQGTLENIKAVSFTPMLDTVKPIVDTANDIAGWTQEFAKAHPQVAGLTTKLVGFAGVTLTVAGGIKAMTAAWKLWRIASAISNLGAPTAQVNNFGGAWGKLNAMPKTIQFTLLLASIGFTLHELAEFIKTVKEYGLLDKQLKSGAVKNAKEFNELETTAAKAGQPLAPKDYTFRANMIYRDIDREGSLKGSMQGGVTEFLTNLLNIKRGAPFLEQVAQGYLGAQPLLAPLRWTRLMPDYHPFYGADDESKVKLFRERGAGLGMNERVMREFIAQTRARTDVSQQGKDYLLNLAKQAFPEMFARATTETAEALLNLNQPAKDLSEAFGQCIDPAQKFPPAMQRSTEAATAFANRVNSLQLGTPQFPGLSAGPQATTGTPQPGAAGAPPKSAIGSIVQKGGLAEVHRGNVITPAALSRRSPGDWLSDLTALRTVSSQAARTSGRPISTLSARAVSEVPAAANAIPPQNNFNSFLRVNNDSRVRLNLRENSYRLIETARSAIRNDITNVFQPNVQLGNISVQSDSNIDSIIAQVKAEQERQLAELRKELVAAQSLRSYDRRGARAMTIGRERA